MRDAMRPLCGMVYGIGIVACGFPRPADVGAVEDASNTAADAGRGTVHVTVFDPGGQGVPAVGATVLFFDPDGSLVKRTSTDTNGRAEADVLPGTSVTSVASTTTLYDLETVLAVKPGDDIAMGPHPDNSPDGIFNVTFSTFSGSTPGTTRYTVSGPCLAGFNTPPVGTKSVTLATSVSPFCKTNPMEIVVTADNTGDVITMLDQTGIPFVNNGSVTMSSQYQAPLDFKASYTNIHPIISSLSLGRSVPVGGVVQSFRNVMTPPAMLSVAFPGAIGAEAQVETTVDKGTVQPAIQRVRQNLSGSAASYGLEVGATLLPWLDTPSFDPTGRTLLVPIDSTGTTNGKPDAFRIVASYPRTDAASNKIFYTWTLYAPEPADITLPMLPPDLDDIMPSATDVVHATATMFEADTVSGYDAVRNDLPGAFVVYLGAANAATKVRESRSPR